MWDSHQLVTDSSGGLGKFLNANRSLNHPEDIETRRLHPCDINMCKMFIHHPSSFPRDRAYSPILLYVNAHPLPRRARFTLPALWEILALCYPGNLSGNGWSPEGGKHDNGSFTPPLSRVPTPGPTYERYFSFYPCLILGAFVTLHLHACLFHG